MATMDKDVRDVAIPLEVAWDARKWLIDLPWSARAVWPSIRCHVKASGNGRGSCPAVEPVYFSRVRDIPLEDVEACIHAAVSAGEMSIEEGRWSLPKELVQSPDALRKRAERERHGQTPNVTDIAETSRKQKGSHGQSGNVQDVSANGGEPLSPLDGPPSPNNPIPPYNPPNPDSLGSKKSKVVQTEIDAAFERFRKAYPKRNGAALIFKAKDKFASLLKGGEDAEVLIAAADKYREWAEATQKVGTELVAQMPTWLNQRRWLEDYSVPDPVTKVDEALKFRKEPVANLDYILKEDPNDRDEGDRPKVRKWDPKTGDWFDTEAWREARKVPA